MFKRLSKAVLAGTGALLLTATSAGAHTGHSLTYSNNGVANSSTGTGSSTFVYGAYEPTSYESDLPAGLRIAHADTKGNELASNPNDEEEIGTGTAKANWNLFFGCSISTQNLTVTWEEDFTGSPSASAVAHFVVTNAIGFDTHVWVIEQNDSTNDYKLVADLDEGRTCATQPSDTSSNLTTYGTTSGGRIVMQNPPAGTYTFTTTFIDVAGGTHSGSDTETYA